MFFNFYYFVSASLVFYMNYTAHEFSSCCLGLQYYTNSSLKSTTSEETSSGASLYAKEETGGVITVEDVQNVEKNESDVQNVEKNESEGTEGAKEESSVDDQIQPFEFLDKLNIEVYL